MEQAKDFITDKAEDVADAIETAFNHPQAVAQQALGTAVALTSAGDRSREGGVTFYENCVGGCWLVLNIAHADAITLGHDVFVKDSLSNRLKAHELTHVRQGDAYGPAWLPAYLWENYRNGYGCNRFEEEARRAAGETSRCNRKE